MGVAALCSSAPRLALIVGFPEETAVFVSSLLNTRGPSKGSSMTSFCRAHLMCARRAVAFGRSKAAQLLCY